MDMHQREQWKAHIESWLEKAKARLHTVAEKTTTALREKTHKSGSSSDKK